MRDSSLRLLRLLCAEQFPLYGVHKTCEMRPQITARRSRTKVESECFAYTREVRRSLYRQIFSTTVSREDVCCARSCCTYGVRLLCLRHGAIVRNVFWSDPNLGDGSFRMARARYKRTRSTDNMIHVSGMADRRAAYTLVHSISDSLPCLHLFAVSSSFVLLPSRDGGVTGMCVSESNHGEQRAENPDPMNRL